MSIRYRKRSDGRVVTYSRTMPRLERSDQWERVDDVPAAPVRPADSAPKGPWETYAASLDIDTDGMTKAEIIEAVDGS